MKLIIQNTRIAAAATDDYTGPDDFITAPADFDSTRIADYIVRDGELALAVPQSVTMRQARLALLASGKLAGVDAAIDALPEPHRPAARIEWEYAQSVERNSDLTLMMGAALELDGSAIDALFVVAAGL